MRYLRTLSLVAGLLLAPCLVLAQGAPQRPSTPSGPQKTPPPASPQQPPPGVTILQDMPDARETRNRLNDIFQQYPPSVRDVLRIDPTLMYRADYIGNYPVLAAFLEQHPEVAHNPAFFIGERQYEERRSNPAYEAFNALNRAVEFFAMIVVIGTITTGILLLARTIIEHRRWQRAMRAQTELQNKLVDRFASSDDLIAYLQSPPGKALTEAPVLQHSSSRPISAPLSRIFWSLQSGIVVGALGLGLLFVSTSATNDEVRQVLCGVGVVVLTIGVGFTTSAMVSYFLSQRLGLVQPPQPRITGEAPGS